MTHDDVYIFQQSSENVMAHLGNYWANEVTSGPTTSPIFNRWLRSFYFYYGFQFFNYGMEAGLATIGDQGEFVGYAPNQFRNIIKTGLGILTQNRVAFDTTPVSDDVMDVNIAEVANPIIENYYYSRNNEKEIGNSVEAGVVLGTAFGGWFWKPMSRIIEVDLEGNPIWEGDLTFDYFLPFDVRLETFIDNDKNLKWITFRRKINRFELIGMYPDKKEELLRVDPIPRAVVGNDFTHNMDVVWVKEFYHVSQPGFYTGRMMIYAGDVVLEDGPNPYRNPKELYSGMPLCRFRPDVIFGSSYGHSVSFDLLPSQEYLGIIQTAIASAVNSMGTPNIVLPSANSIDNIEEIANGLRFIFYKPVEGAKDGGMPQTLNLLSLSPDLMRERDLCVRDMEQVSAINSALRGNPQPGVQAASAIALLTTQAQTYNSALQQNYVIYNEQLAKKLLHCCAIFMKNKQIVDIVGISQKFSALDFTASALSRIRDVRVTVGNFLSKSLAGRLTMGEQLLNSQQINATEYAQILDTGQVTPIIKEKASEENLINWENEQLLRGQEVYVEPTENHLMHILKHAEQLKIPQVKSNLGLATSLRNHIADHQDEYQKLSVDNPQLLALITGSPIPPIPPAPGTVGMEEGGEAMVEGEAPSPPSGGGEEVATEQAAQQSGDADALAAKALRRASTEVSKAQMAAG